jgi:aconitate hydratase
MTTATATNTTSRSHNAFGARSILQVGNQQFAYYRLAKLQEDGIADISKLPFSIKIMLEAVLRECNDYDVTQEDVRALANYDASAPAEVEVPFKLARVILQDFTGVPAVVDLASMRTAMAKLGGDPLKINPLIPVDLVIDHSVQVDYYASDDALFKNSELEFERNRERYEFLRWGQQALDNFGVVPPASGIVHQVNLEYLAKGVMSRPDGDLAVLFPDTLVGTDSHTTMINGLGIVGWGVGGIEAEAVMLGQPLYMLTPEVVGFKISGKLPEGATATDLALVVTQMLRKNNVVGKFVEFYGAGLSSMTLPDRATIANMAPEYGATMGFFPMDDEAMRYLRRTGRLEDEVETVAAYMKAQGLYRDDSTADPVFSSYIELDLGSVKPSLAGPARPQDRVLLGDMQSVYREALVAPKDKRGYGLTSEQLAAKGNVADHHGWSGQLGHGDVVIASITSCTNTSNPSVMLGAGILAKKAAERGLTVKPWVKTSLAPGSKVVTEYLNDAGLTPFLDQLGFQTVGYGCTTCIGNSGPLDEPIVAAINQGDLVAASVLSGNRNFEGRVNQHVRANYLASPPLVVAYALAGTVDTNLETDPLGTGSDGQPVYLRDVWPSSAEIAAHLDNATSPDTFRRIYDGIEQSNQQWNAIPVAGGALFDWKDQSTYIQNPPYFDDLAAEPGPIAAIRGARVLAMLGDSVTTDHISPAGAFNTKSAAGKYLAGLGVALADFNSYGSRRGNDRVMTRGTFANIRIRNQLAPGTEGGVTTHLPTGEVISIYEAAMRYKTAATPLVVLGGVDYGMGSSRDWAAKGTMLLGVKAVIVESFERIHRSNLAGMGVLPLQYKNGENAASLGLTGSESFDIVIDNDLKPRQDVTVRATASDGSVKEFTTRCRIDTPVEVDYYRNGGILQFVLRQLLK